MIVMPGQQQCYCSLVIHLIAFIENIDRFLKKNFNRLLTVRRTFKLSSKIDVIVKLTKSHMYKYIKNITENI